MIDSPFETIETELAWVKSQPSGEHELAGICQCATEKLIARSSDSKRMRASLLSLVFFDQFVHSNYMEVYSLWSREFPIIKLKGHASNGYALPSWFVYSYHGYDAKADWDLTYQTFGRCFLQVEQWLNLNSHQLPWSIEENLRREINGTFEEQRRAGFLAAVEEQW